MIAMIIPVVGESVVTATNNKWVYKNTVTERASCTFQSLQDPLLAYLHGMFGCSLRMVTSFTADVCRP